MQVPKRATGSRRQLARRGPDGPQGAWTNIEGVRFSPGGFWGAAVTAVTSMKQGRPGRRTIRCRQHWPRRTKRGSKVVTNRATAGLLASRLALHWLTLFDADTKRIDLTLDSVLDSVETVEQTVEGLAREAGFLEDTASQMAMVSREAAVNAVLHGNKFDLNKKVRASFELTRTSLTIKVADEGPGLDPDQVPDPLAPENLLRSSGRGIFLMRAIMDEVHFRQLTPGTEITLIKYREQKETEA